jgi:hypothetical protein
MSGSGQCPCALRPLQLLAGIQQLLRWPVLQEGLYSAAVFLVFPSRQVANGSMPCQLGLVLLHSF